MVVYALTAEMASAGRYIWEMAWAFQTRPLPYIQTNDTFSGSPKWPDESDLPNLNLEPVFVTVLEVFPPMANIHLHKRNIHPVLLNQVRAVLTIFVAVPIMIVATVPIVIAPFTMMVVSHHRNWGNHGGSR